MQLSARAISCSPVTCRSWSPRIAAPKTGRHHLEAALKLVLMGYFLWLPTQPPAYYATTCRTCESLLLGRTCHKQNHSLYRSSTWTIDDKDSLFILDNLFRTTANSLRVSSKTCAGTTIAPLCMNSDRKAWEIPTLHLTQARYECGSNSL